jgi:hypothetical protein
MIEQTVNTHHISAKNAVAVRIQFPHGETANYERHELEHCLRDARQWIEVVQAALEMLDQVAKRQRGGDEHS